MILPEICSTKVAADETAIHMVSKRRNPQTCLSWGLRTKLVTTLDGVVWILIYNDQSLTMQTCAPKIAWVTNTASGHINLPMFPDKYRLYDKEILEQGRVDVGL